MNLQHRRKNWSYHELVVVNSMRANGESYSDIGKALGRSAHSIQSRCFYRPKRPSKHPAPPPAPLLTITIFKAGLPALYEKGWRIVGFSGNEVTLEWPYSHMSPESLMPSHPDIHERIPA